jgi:acetylornithine deacetylase/succinyl-diaminopimelate desuccinylase-like protein
MKGGIAAILSALDSFKKVEGLTLLFYCDEEYGFQGTKKFIEKNKKDLGKLVIIAEPSNLEIWNMNRGLIELGFNLKGKTGHAAFSSSGKNALEGMGQLLVNLKLWTEKFVDPDLGKSTLNIAYLQGGLYLGSKDKKVVLGKSGNNIADYAEVIIEIRTASVKLTTDSLTRWLKRESQKLGFKLQNVKVQHDLGPLYTKRTDLKNIELIQKKIINQVRYADPQKRGYSDGQLLQKKFNIPVVNIGPIGANSHSVNEWVDIRSLEVLRRFYVEAINQLCP